MQFIHISHEGFLTPRRQGVKRPRKKVETVPHLGGSTSVSSANC